MGLSPIISQASRLHCGVVVALLLSEEPMHIACASSWIERSILEFYRLNHDKICFGAHSYRCKKLRSRPPTRLKSDIA